MYKMLRLIKNIENDNFSRLLDLCFKYSSYFSFTKNGYESIANGITHINFIRDMSPFYIKTIQTQHWHCFYVPQENTLEVYLYKANEQAKAIIQNYFDNIFLRYRNSNGTLEDVKDTPEDLCFFLDNKLLIGTVSHEDICYVYPPTKQVSEEFKKIGKWQEIEYLQEEHISIQI